MYVLVLKHRYRTNIRALTFAKSLGQNLIKSVHFYQFHGFRTRNTGEKTYMRISTEQNDVSRSRGVVNSLHRSLFHGL
jgi:hypothetical protein